MTRNTIGGKGHKKAKKHVHSEKRNMPYKDAEEGTDYAIVKKLLGSGWVNLMCLSDNKVRLGKIRGNMYKKIWIGTADVVLISYRGFQDNKCDIVFKYNNEEIQVLINRGQITYEQLQGEDKNVPDDNELVIFGDNDNLNIDAI